MTHQDGAAMGLQIRFERLLRSVFSLISIELTALYPSLRRWLVIPSSHLDFTPFSPVKQFKVLSSM